LVGDLAKACIVHLKPFLNEYIPLLNRNLYPDYIAVCNNSSWAIGEIAIRVTSDDMKPFVTPIMQRLVSLINKQNLNQNLSENTAITIGRLGFVCPDIIAPHLEEFVQNWCLILRNMRDDYEKDSAFRGLCKMIKINPGGVVKHFPYVCDAIASWEIPKQDLKEMFMAILHGFKNSMNPQPWADYFQNFPQDLRNILELKYQL